MSWRECLAMFLALNCAKHAAEVYYKFGFAAGIIAIVFMLAFGEVIRAWIKMLRGL